MSYKNAIHEWKGKMPHGHANILIDLDGSCAEYTGWISHLHIGKPIPAAIEKIKRWLAEGYQVKIFTARASVPETLKEVTEAIQAWTLEHVGARLPVVCSKDFNTVEIWDDRARQFVPNTGLSVQEYYEQYEILYNE